MPRLLANRLLAPLTGGLVALVLLSLPLIESPSAAPPGGLPPGLDPARLDILQGRAVDSGSVAVIVGFDIAMDQSGGFRPEGLFERVGEKAAQQAAIRQVQDRLLQRTAGLHTANAKRFAHIPFVALRAGPHALEALARMPEVTSIEPDRLTEPVLAESVPLVGGDTAWASGYTGAGQAVAVLDTGVDKLHGFLADKVVSEACYSTTGDGGSFTATTVCPNGLDEQTGDGAGVNCPTSIYGCSHGTHVAGIAAGSGSSFSGVAKDASLIAVQVFTELSDKSLADPQPDVCGSLPDPCAQAYTSDIILGLERVYALRDTLAIASVNMSLGGGRYTSEGDCDAANPSTKAAIDNLRSVGIATVVASGNNGFTDALSYPACISSAVSVGATTEADAIAYYSNSASFLDLLAPGSSITSSVPGGGYATWNGTSMATPHVAGAWAVLKEKSPAATVDEILSGLVGSGKAILDSRNGITKPRIDLAPIAGTVSPVIETAGLAVGTVGEPYSQTLTASGGAPPYSWEVTAGALPEGLALDPGTGEIYGTPSLDGTSDFTVEVTDTAGGTDTRDLSLAVAAAPPPEGTLVLTTDNSDQVYLNGVLIGASADWRQASSYTLAFQPGDNVIAVKGVDAGGVAALIAELVLPDGTRVTSGPAWKVSTSLQSGWQQPGFDDSAWAGASTYGSYGADPWKENVAGFPGNSTAQWIWSADNADDNTVYVRYSFQIGESPLTLDTSALPDGTVGEPYSQTLTASDGAPPYSWEVTAGALPEGLALDPGTGEIYGTPSLDGTSDFTVEVTDTAGGTDTRDLSLAVAAAPPPEGTLVLTTDNSDQVYLNGVLIGASADWRQASSYTLAFQPGDNVIAVKGVDAGGVAALIAELVLPDGTRVTSGPAWKVSTSLQSGWQQPGFDDSAWAGASTYGSYGADPWKENVAGFPGNSTAQWIWSADNADDNTVYVRYSFQIGESPLTLDTSALPDGTVGEPYSQTLTASGGAPPYSWEVTAGALPEGLALDPGTGEIYGTPSLDGTSDFTVEVTDTAGGTDTRDLSLAVAAAPPPEGTLVLTTDNSDQVYLNGVLIGASADWRQASSYTLAFQPGNNVIAMKGADAGGVAALIAELVLPDGTRVTSGPAWKVSTSLQSGWQQPGFDDSAWASASTYGSYGADPWKENVAGFPSNSTAQWIWSADNADDNTVYVRYSVQISTGDGGAP